MPFYSILFKSPHKESAGQACSMPEFFADLNLDQMVEAILDGKEEYELQRFFYCSLKDEAAVQYRQDVMKDMENRQLFESILDFSHKMGRIREYLGFSRDLHNAYQRKKWFLDAGQLYCNAVQKLQQALNALSFASEGLRLFHEWIREYAGSEPFISLLTHTEALQAEFTGVHYSLQIGNDSVTIGPDDRETDFCASLNETFEKLNDTRFQYEIKFFTGLEMCVLEAKVLELVRKQNPDVFSHLDRYCDLHQDFVDATLQIFDREIQFYLSYLKYIDKLKQAGLPFSYPKVSRSKEINVVGGCDAAFAYKARISTIPVVCNDFYLENQERIYILTGPNQGGKTTFARAFGQILYLASLGCPVPCQKAELFLFDNIFTHFPVEENLTTKSGRLKEELGRLGDILKKATPDSILILNELFATTTSHDAYRMGKRILEEFIRMDCLCVYVTHIYELALISGKMVSLIAQVKAGEDKIPVRTYKILRKAADGVVYANSIVNQYGLTYDKIKERIGI